MSKAAEPGGTGTVVSREFGTPLPETQRVDATAKFSQDELITVLVKEVVNRQSEHHHGTWRGHVEFVTISFSDGEFEVSAKVNVWKEDLTSTSQEQIQ